MSTHRSDVLAVVIGRAGSRGLPGKNSLLLAGRAMICHTIDAARAATTVGRVIVSTDGPAIAAAAKAMGVPVIDRPTALANDTATVDAAVRHAVERDGGSESIIVILYANVPVRPAGLIDRAVRALAETNADSVQSYARMGKHHPEWMVHLDDAGRVTPYTESRAYRRQDLPAVHLPDGGVIAVRRASLFTVDPDQPHAFLGADRRGVETSDGAVVDVDTAADLRLAASALAPDTTTAPSLHVGTRSIGPEHPPYVIAEIGVNHDGSVERAFELVDAALDAGAQAIKLQHFRAEQLLSQSARLAAYQRRAGATDPMTMLEALELTDGEIAAIVDRAHAGGLEAIVTVFSVQLVPALADVAVDAYKTASPDIVNRPLIEALLARGRPLLLSTGAASLGEVAEAVSWIGNAPHLLLHCVSSYPTPAGDAQLNGRRAMLAVSPFALGYSDHTADVDTGALAVAGGACLLEKHLTYDRAAAGPDHAASLEPADLAAYVEAAHRAWRMTGRLEKAVSPLEADVRLGSRQSVTAVRALPAGHRLEPGDLTIKRPGTGLSPARLASVLGRELARPVAADALLHEEDLLPPTAITGVTAPAPTEARGPAVEV